jgi:hypothetical protein
LKQTSKQQKKYKIDKKESMQMNVIANSMQFSASKKYDSSSLQIVV